MVPIFPGAGSKSLSAKSERPAAGSGAAARGVPGGPRAGWAGRLAAGWRAVHGTAIH